MEAVLDVPSPNQDDRPAGAQIDMLVLHYTGMVTGEAALERLTNVDAEVSAHYLVEEDGRIFRLVAEDRRAWHAGVSFWRGRKSLNATSIGIEIVNPGHDFGYRPFPETQMAAVETLAAEIVARHDIPARNIVGHSDVAPTRKRDPGEYFDWQRLARKGIGLWPEPAAAAPKDVMATLAFIGYETSAFSATVAAFQRHYRPSEVHGYADSETARLVAGLADLIGRTG